MTEKLFQEDRYKIIEGMIWDTYKKLPITPKLTEKECEVIIAHLNYHKDFIERKSKQLIYRYKKIVELEEENEQLKQREERLLSEIEDFQELLAKNDNVCYKRVIDLIDDKIFIFSNVKAELLLNNDDDYRLEKLSFAIQNLRELKKELEE